MTIIINNVYSFRNRGDSAIVESMVQYFRKRIPDVNIILASTFWEENKAYYDQLNCESMPPLWDVPMAKNKMLRLMLAMGGFTKLLMTLLIPTIFLSKKSMARKYRTAELLVDVGGGSFFSSNKYYFYLGFYQHLLNLLCRKWMKLPVAIAPQSMGPFNKNHDIRAFRYVMKKMDCVMVREKISVDLMEHMNLDCDLVPDCAFMDNFVVNRTKQTDSALSLIDVKRTNIGMTVLDWSWAISGMSKNACNEYLSKIALAASQLDINDVVFHLFSQTDVSTERSDYEVAGELSQMLHSRGIECVVHDPANTASDLCYLYREMDVFVGSRMHSCIFALNQSVPLVALAYQPKTTGVLSWVSDKLEILPIDTFSSEELTDAIQYTIEHRDMLSNEIQACVANMKINVTQAFDDRFLPLMRR